MLAAVPDFNLSLGLLENVLVSLSNDQEPVISDSLKNHFLYVLQSAAALANNPDKINSKSSSDAIELAFRMREKEKFLKIITKIDSFGSIKSADAKILLDSLKKNAA